MLIDEMLDITERQALETKSHAYWLLVCMASGCRSSNSEVLKNALDAAVSAAGMSETCAVKGVGCLGLCAAGPLVYVEPAGILYQKVTPEDAADIVQSLGGQPVERLLCPQNIPFFERQHKVVLKNSGVIDPLDLEEYIAEGGYQSLVQVLTEMSPMDVVQEIVRSGLRGRGGAGYPTGLKWTTVSKAVHPKKYVVCNADEGDPGAFMDRSVLESDPQRVLEGMAIAGYAVGADEGYIYVRAEYPLAVEHLKKAIKAAEKVGLLGNRLCNTTFDFRIQLRLGAGAFVCGEETALLSSIEGKRGIPRPRPPYPAEHGLWGCPTLVNNVETFANIPAIIRNGAAWFAAMGTEKSKGTKVFALAGQIRNTGLIEVPMGMTLREIIMDIGGGPPDGRKVKAVQTGGPSGGCIPEQHLDIPVDYDSLKSLGSIMGSGGMIVMDESSCMVDVAAYFMDFCVSESCGRCVPCRVGTAHMLELLKKIIRFKATLEDLKKLEELSDLVMNTSLCGLGQTAPNPVNSTLRFFRDEYMAHILEHRCPAGVCK